MGVWGEIYARTMLRLAAAQSATTGWTFERIAAVVAFIAAIAALLDFFGVRAWVIGVARPRLRVRVPARRIAQVLELSAVVAVILVTVFVSGRPQAWTLVGLAGLIAVLGVARLVDEWGESGFRVLHATYGSLERTRDVAAQVLGFVSEERLDFVANNDTLGPDPAPNETKTFWIEYRVGGKRFERTYTEGEHVVLP
jgi:hypothetical protein